MITNFNIDDTVYLIQHHTVASGKVYEVGYTGTKGEFIKFSANGDKFYIDMLLDKTMFTSKAKAQATLENRTCQECIHRPICKAYKKKHPDVLWKDECALVCPQYKNHLKYLYLPFTLKDTVYVITKSPNNTSNKEIVRCEVSSLRILNDTNDISYCCTGRYSNGSIYQGNFRTSSVGKKVFLYEEDAKEKL